MSWLTIESDPGVFSALISDLGVKDVNVVDLLSIDAATLDALQPNWGVIFLFKYQNNEKQTPSTNEADYIDEKVWFAHQRIQNACGTQALLALLLNHQDEIHLGPELSMFRDFTAQFPPDLRGEAMTNSDLLREAHNSFSPSEMFHLDNEGSPTSGEAPYHFISYSKINGRLYELDGLQPAPIDHGDCGPTEFGTKLEQVLQERISRYSGELNFNLMGLTRDPLADGAQSLSPDEKQRELEKREQRNREVILRRHGFAGAVVALTKALVRNKTSSEVDALLSNGKQRNAERQQKRARSK